MALSTSQNRLQSNVKNIYQKTDERGIEGNRRERKKRVTKKTPATHEIVAYAA